MRARDVMTFNPATVTPDDSIAYAASLIAVVIPAGVRHNVVNLSDDAPLQLYTSA